MFQIIPKDQIKRGKELGRGAYGVVYEGSYDVTTKIAIKAIPEHALVPEMKALFDKEIGIMANLNHPCVVRFLGICLEQEHHSIIMEYLPRGNLLDILKNKQEAFPWKPQRWQVIIDIASGLRYLHTRPRPIIHRDLKSENILISQDWHAKITDFGISRIKHFLKPAVTGKLRGTYRWIAPELFGKKIPVSKESDIYAFGMVCVEIHTRKLPWLNANSPEEIIAAAKNLEKKPLKLTQPVNQEFAEVVEACCTHNPKKRPSANVVVTKLLAAYAKDHTADKMYNKGLDLWRKGEYVSAVDLFKKATDANHALAHYSLGQCLYFGHGIIKNPKLSITHIKQAADLGLAEAQLHYGTYLYSLGDPKHFTETFKYLKLAANRPKPDPQALFRLALCYLKGHGTSPNPPEAAKLFRQAADAGLTKAAGHVAQLNPQLAAHYRSLAHWRSFQGLFPVSTSLEMPAPEKKEAPLNNNPPQK